MGILANCVAGTVLRRSLYFNVFQHLVQVFTGLQFDLYHNYILNHFNLCMYYILLSNTQFYVYVEYTLSASRMNYLMILHLTYTPHTTFTHIYCIMYIYPIPILQNNNLLTFDPYALNSCSKNNKKSIHFFACKKEPHPSTIGNSNQTPVFPFFYLAECM